MADKQLKILRSEEIAEGTRAFHLERPAGFDYVSGQTIDLTLIDPKVMDAEGPVRTFSLVSAPHEAELVFATRMRSTAFKNAIAIAKPGTPLAWDGPYGSFTLHKNAAKPAVFLAGGIGITPFMSIVKSAIHEHLPHQLYLFHANNRPEDAPFLDDLTALAHSNAGGPDNGTRAKLQYVSAMSAMEKSSKPWSGERGFIDKAMLERHLSDLHAPIYYIAGPPAMVTAMRKMLTEAGIDEDNIRFEEFPGY
jgi:ferredoxin-NADP reductase